MDFSRFRSATNLVEKGSGDAPGQIPSVPGLLRRQPSPKKSGDQKEDVMKRRHGSCQPSGGDCMRRDQVANYRFPVLTKVTAVLFLTCLWTPAVRAQIGAGFSTIDPPQSVFTLAFGINDHHKIVGTYYDADGLGHGFLRTEDGHFVTIDHPRALTANGFGTEGRGINSSGQIVGDYCAAPPCDGVSVIKGYLLTKESDTENELAEDDLKTLETQGHINSHLQHINAESDIG